MSNTTRQVICGGVAIGGGAPVCVQSMLCAPAHDTPANIAQARELQAAGCDIVRVAVPDREAVGLVAALREAVDMPVVADIHFDHRLALESVAAGAHKIRINPGNIGGEDRVRAVARSCAAAGVPIRIGVNAGSLEADLLAAHGGPSPEAMAESALRHCRLLERWDFADIVLSLKASDVPTTVRACRLMAGRADYPLHLGVTEAGTERIGLVKSAAGIGALLLDGIGDTIRVSLTADPVREIAAARDILRAVGLGGGVNVVSCPTCGRCKINLFELAAQVEQALRDCPYDLTVAVMGCAVNGPGEARHADLGVAGGDGVGLLFAGGEPIGRVPQEEIVPALLRQIERLYHNGKGGAADAQL